MSFQCEYEGMHIMAQLRGYLIAKSDNTHAIPQDNGILEALTALV